VELHELHVSDGRARPVGDRDAVSQRAGWVGGPLEERPGAPGGDQRHPGRDGDELVMPEHPRAGAGGSVGHQLEHRRVLHHPDPRVFEHALDQRVGDVPAGGAAARVQDPPPAVATLAAELRHAAGPGVEGHAVGLQVSHTRGPLLDQHLDRSRVAEPAPRGQGVGHVQVGMVVLSDCGGDAPLRIERVRAAQGALGDQHHLRVAAGRLEGCVQAREPGACDQQIRLKIGSMLHRGAI
jgi:hypothetical protein